MDAFRHLHTADQCRLARFHDHGRAGDIPGPPLERFPGVDLFTAMWKNCRVQAASARTAKAPPKPDKTQLVTHPIASRVKPSASTSGADVAAGMTTTSSALALGSEFSASSFIRFVYRPKTYTTAKTTIHTESTKCQYQETTSKPTVLRETTPARDSIHIMVRVTRPAVTCKP